MVLASACLGGAYFFVRVVRERQWQWHRVGGVFVEVGCFATLMGVATLMHWDRFLHQNVAFWLWAALYFGTPFLVFFAWFLNRWDSSVPAVDDLLLPDVAVVVIGLVGLTALLTCLFLFLFPGAAIDIWPWPLTTLTSRVLGAIFSLAVDGIGALGERRWSSARILLQVEAIMLVLIAVPSSGRMLLRHVQATDLGVRGRLRGVGDRIGRPVPAHGGPARRQPARCIRWRCGEPARAAPSRSRAVGVVHRRCAPGRPARGQPGAAARAGQVPRGRRGFVGHEIRRAEPAAAIGWPDEPASTAAS